LICTQLSNKPANKGEYFLLFPLITVENAVSPPKIDVNFIQEKMDNKKYKTKQNAMEINGH
jgi:hypothetical protein